MTQTEEPIFGTTFFDGDMAMKGYALNKMCYSFNKAENREAFLRDEEAYYAHYGLTEAQKAACRKRVVLDMIHKHVRKVASRHGITMVYFREDAILFSQATHDITEDVRRSIQKELDRIDKE